MELEELFRQKLENAELTPGEIVGARLMKRLGRKEFLHFSPTRFNIYYAGGIIATAITAAAFLLFDRETGNKTDSIIPPQQTVITDTLISFSAAEEPETKSAVSDIRKENRTATAKVKKAGEETQNGFSENSGRDPVMLQVRTGSDSLRKNKAVKESNLAGSVSSATIKKAPVAAFEASSLSGCVPLKVRFMNRSLFFDSCRWQFGDGGYSASDEPEWIFDMAGEYRISLQVFGADGETSAAWKLVKVYPRPVARFEFLPEKPIIPDDEVRFVNYSMDAVRYRWDFGNGKSSAAFEPVHKYSTYRDYNLKLTVWSEHGCSDSVVVKNAFAGSGCYITFPNAFIPNPDGPAGGYYSVKSDEAAQIFHPVTSGVSEYQLRIFSKAGILIFESNDINIGWDGYHKGQLCDPGVYVWKVRGTYKNGESFVKMGDVTLIKN